MEPSNPTLQSYIQNIPGHEKLLGSGNKSTSLPLRHGVMNRVLFYPGCFNPPHLAHLALLQHMYGNSGKDQNYVAAIVFPVDHELVEKKLPENHGQLILTKQERASLWQGLDRAENFYVYEGLFKEWQLFFGMLRARVAQDGYELNVSILSGPDHMYEMEVQPAFGHMGYDDWLYSDCSRDIEEFRQVKQYKAWEPVVIDCEKTEEIAESLASLVIAGMFMVAPKSAEDMLKNGKSQAQMVPFYLPNWISNSVSEPEMKERLVKEILAKSKGSTLKGQVAPRIESTVPESLRFIEKPSTEEVPRISSSDIRRVISSAPWDQLEAGLRGKTLNTEALVELLKKKYPEYLSSHAVSAQ